MRRYGEQEALSHREAESWISQAAEVRSRSRAIDRELGQPFFAWLTARPGAGGREIGVAGAMRLASPQTPEDAEELRAHAAAFIAERFPTPEGPDPASVPGLADYERTRDGLKESHARETEAAWGGWSDAVRDRGRGAGPGKVETRARRGRAQTEHDLRARQAGREERAKDVKAGMARGREGVKAELAKPFQEHAAKEAPFIGEWLAGKLYGTARNAAPDRGKKGEKDDRGRDGPFYGDQVLGP